MDKKSSQIFKELLQSESFYVALDKERQSIIKLNGGFESIKKERYFKNKKTVDRFNKGIKNILVKFKLPDNFHSLIDDYLVYGQLKESKYFGPPVSIYGAGISVYGSPKEVTLHIMPGAVRAEVLNFLDSWWPRIERWFKKHYPDEYKKRVKQKTKWDRDVKIFLLRKLKILKSYGAIDYNRADEHYQIHPSGQIKTESYYKKMILEKEGIELPSRNTIRNIIAQMRKKSR